MEFEEYTLNNGEIVVLHISPVSELVSQIDVYPPDNEDRIIYTRSFSPYITIDDAIFHAENRRVF